MLINDYDEIETKKKFLMSIVKLLCPVSRIGTISRYMLTGNFSLILNNRIDYEILNNKKIGQPV